MKLVVHFRPDAETDIANAAAWYETQKTGLGAEFLNEILSACNSIGENPEIYPLVHRKARRAVIQKFPFGIYYRIEHGLVKNGLVTIVAVLHGSRDPEKWKSRT